MKRVVTFMTFILLVATAAVVTRQAHASTSVATHGQAPVSPVVGLCAFHQGDCAAVPDQAAALAKVSAMIKHISGGALPNRIDVTKTVASAVVLSDGNNLVDSLNLPPETQVWYVRIHNPVAVTHSSPFGAMAETPVHGAAWVIDAQTGFVLAFSTFG